MEYHIFTILSNRYTSIPKLVSVSAQAPSTATFATFLFENFPRISSSLFAFPPCPAGTLFKHSHSLIPRSFSVLYKIMFPSVCRLFPPPQSPHFPTTHVAFTLLSPFLSHYLLFTSHALRFPLFFLEISFSLSIPHSFYFRSSFNPRETIAPRLVPPTPFTPHSFAFFSRPAPLRRRRCALNCSLDLFIFINSAVFPFPFSSTR